jgi:5-methylthioadenosine/S-adenosylhomocysteine deaminase
MHNAEQGRARHWHAHCERGIGEVRMTSLVLRGALVMQDGQSVFRPDPCDVLIEDQRIRAIAPIGTLSSPAHEIDARGLIATPGLINGHLHSWDHFIKGRTENLPMEMVMAHLRPALPLPLTERHIYLRTMMTALECLRTGATTVVDDLSLGQTFDRRHVDAALQAYQDAGVRAYVGFSMIDKPVVNSWPFVEERFAADVLRTLRSLPRPRGEELLGLVRELAITHHPSSSRVAVLVAPSAPQRCSDSFLRSCRGLADELDLPIMVHVLETRLQVVTAQIFWGCSMVEHLLALDFLGPRTALIHGVWLSPRDRKLIAEAGATVQYNPWSNAAIGSGIADFRALRDAGINVAMGSDGCGVTFNCSMLLALKFGAGLGRVRTADHHRWPSADEIWEAATRGGARALGREAELGRLAPGCKADIVLYRLSSIGLVPLNSPVRQLVHAECGSGIDTIIIDGEVVMRSGKFTRVDEDALIAQFQAAHADLLESIAASEAASEALLAGLGRIYRRPLSIAIPEDVTRGVVDLPTIPAEGVAL